MIAALMLTPLMRTMLVGLKPTDPLTFVTMMLLFLAIRLANHRKLKTKILSGLPVTLDSMPAWRSGLLMVGTGWLRILDMGSASDIETILVTGASGHIGRELCRVLRNAECRVLPLDLNHDKTGDVLNCDLRSKSDVSKLFQVYRIRTVIHLAGILPSAFLTDPLTGAEVNLGGSCELMRQAAAAHVDRFIFASSMSVYGSSPTRRPVNEDDPPAPDEPYGAAKLAVELIGQTLARAGAFEFAALRIARVVGPGIKKTSSPWRSQIFKPCPQQDSVCVPFAPEAILSLIHVEDVARVLCTLAETAEMSTCVYNTPAEIWEASHLKEAIEELRRIRVELRPEVAHGGPICDGSRFAREFGFKLRGLRDHLASNPASFG